MAVTCPNCRFIQQNELYICPECGTIRCNFTTCLRQYNSVIAREGELCHICKKGHWEKIIQPANLALDTMLITRF